ncbi:hypothetical protein GW889_00740 [Candidatus Berkelbacteria bacterium]|uniref:Type 4 fimbrial biogenesis protein PilX N-terminal domain-containing protein n=1 Tax=Candidatus Berkelbacteria bacterium CG10_big_fil_rev_8_21_14_0_10_43_14 TaxID=1974515 RepID=A0A2M6R9Q4_9BACT|nr:hypothetical protein [Candidatus Berkelbacteria bacterium]OIP07247.1 MAG: hypothetical protein AUK41_00145 [Candidatus Berkelbacteria bacterium CG2_30_43_20]PIS06790.1 MAG: hypothetical protein COT79_02740 [Candidatus Berkelbacteria bacterium CG10_big_fil_rev_8_21_14_0_10_43_14]PIU87129.1 MAG: hypothetical protein COS66_02555 [Candidatus Berkelbacteria bacterium CG06_land_8_20_14_3_00_43_10]
MIYTRKQKGFTVVFAVIVIASLAVLVLGLYSLNSTMYGNTGRLVALSQARSLAQGGIDRAVHALSYDQSYTGESDLALPPVDGVLDIVVSAPDATTRIITATAYIPNKVLPLITYTTSAQGVASLGSQGNVFSFALQVGQGGFYASNNVHINGNIYSNADIAIEGSGSSVSGDASAVGEVEINGHVGTMHEGVPVVPMTQVDFSAWHNEAQAHGTTHVGDLAISSNSPLTLGGDGNISVITGRLLISSSPQITLAGPVWIKGIGGSSLEISGNAKFTIPSSFAQSTTAIIADQKITISGNAQFSTDKMGAYMMIVSDYPGTLTPDTPAIDIAANAKFDAATLFAPNGKLTFTSATSGVSAIAFEAQKIHIDSNLTLNYQQGLASLSFKQPNTPSGGGFTITPGSYSVPTP